MVALLRCVPRGAFTTPSSESLPPNTVADGFALPARGTMKRGSLAPLEEAHRPLGSVGNLLCKSDRLPGGAQMLSTDRRRSDGVFGCRGIGTTGGCSDG